MNDDLVNGWDELKDTLPYDHAVAAELLFDYGDKLADRITALKAERDALAEKLERAVVALQSIASNTCCDTCQEAALVARAALQENPDG